MKYAGIEAVSTGEVVRQWGLRDCIRNCTIESEPLRIVGYHVIGSQRDTRHHVPRRVYRGSARPKGAVASSRNVAQQPAPRVGRVDQSICRACFRQSESLDVCEKECLVPPDGPADAAALDILDELALAKIAKVQSPLIRVQSRSAIKPECISVEFVRPRFTDQ